GGGPGRGGRGQGVVVDVSVGGDVGRADDALAVDEGKTIARLVRRETVDLEAEVAGVGHGPADFGPAGGRRSEPERTDLLPIDGATGFPFEPVEDRDRILHQ